MDNDINVDLMMQKAFAGDVEAQLIMGNWYLDGNNVQQDSAEAIRWYKMAADAGNMLGLSLVGYVYEQEENYQAALSWYRKAADLGDAMAQYQIGTLYEYGTGVEENAEEALVWYLKAAEQDNADAQAAAGGIYHLLAAKYRHESASILANSVIFWQDVDGSVLGEREQQAKAINDKATFYKSEAARWSQRGAQNNNPIAQYICGNIFQENNDFEMALYWYYKAADFEMPLAMHEIGKMHEKGQGVAADDLAALSWYKRALAAGADAALDSINRVTGKLPVTIQETTRNRLEVSSKNDTIAFLDEVERYLVSIENAVTPLINKIINIDRRIDQIDSEVRSAEYKVSKAGSIGLLLFLLLFFIPGMLYLIYFIIARVTASAKAKEIAENAREEISRLNEQRRELVLSKDRILLEYQDRQPDAMRMIPDDYRSLGAIRYIKQALINLRADTLKEAINLYQDYYDKEMRNQQVLDEQRRHSDMMRIQSEMMRYEVERATDELSRANLNSALKK